MLPGEALPDFARAVFAFMRKVIFKPEVVTEKPCTDSHIQCLC